MVKIYKKAVRDKIPLIIRGEGRDCEIENLSDEKFLPLLEEKLQEELDEYLEDKSLDELADLLEIINRLIILKGSSLEELDQIRQKKKEKRGGFEKNILLLKVV